MAGIFGSRRGNVLLETMLIVIVLSVVALGFPIGKQILNDIRQDTNNDADIGSEAQAAINTVDDGYAALFDNLFLFIFVMLLIAVVAASVLIDTLPVFSFIVLIVTPILVVVGMSMANAYQEVIVGEFPTEAALFPKTTFLMEHLPYFVVITALLVAIALYAKRRLLV